MMLYVLMVLLPGLVISGIASFLVKSAFDRYSQVGSIRGYTGAEAAQILLDRAGIHDVRVVPTHGFLSDHYNPLSKELALSEAVYSSRSVAAIGVATHEAGHAIQHATNYVPLWARSALVPVANIGTYMSYGVMLFGTLFRPFLLLGIIGFAAVLLFQLVTLPVEFNASRRAKHLVVESGVVYPEEREGIDRVLNAAALTYVAAAVTTALTLLYYLMRAGLLGGRQDD
jgi:Zn-dependent membrane protease YugP